MGSSIVLIGPSGAGKTAIGQLLSGRLGLPLVELDTVRWDYYAEIGYDREYGQRLRQEQGFEALVDYWKPYDIHGVERILEEYPDGYVITFGAGHSVYEDAGFRARARAALAPYRNVVLLLPSPNVAESAKILEERLNALYPNLGARVKDINQRFLEHPSNAELATLTIYTRGKTPEETCEEIMAKLNS